jgi:hypothetical protein
MMIILVPRAWNLFASVISGQMSVVRVTTSRLVRVALKVLSA